jgi:hypothetical protein
MITSLPYLGPGATTFGFEILALFQGDPKISTTHVVVDDVVSVASRLVDLPITG